MSSTKSVKTRTEIKKTAPAGRERRADAQHNIDRILDAAIDCLALNPGSSTTEIAQAAGVGRVTVYAHFPTREDLVEQALLRALQRGEERLATVDLTVSPEAALRELLHVSWELTAQASAVLAAAQAVLPQERIQQLHSTPATRLADLIARGQDDGSFREDFPATWLTSLAHHVIHGVATDVAAGRLAAEDAADFISRVLLSAFVRSCEKARD